MVTTRLCAKNLHVYCLLHDEIDNLVRIKQ